MPVVMFLEKNSSSNATSSGMNMSISWFTPVKIARRRDGVGVCAAVVSAPYWISRCLLPSDSITP